MKTILTRNSSDSRTTDRHQPDWRRRHVSVVILALLFGAFLFPFSGTLRADDGDTLETATPISPGKRNASLTSGDDDWFVFTLSSTGLIALYTEGDVDTRGRLYDSGGVQFEGNHNDGYGRNFYLREKLNPGTYYLRVSEGTQGPFTGDYSLTLRTQESAPLITGSGFEGNRTAGQVDFYRIPVERLGLLETYTTGLTDTDARLYDQAGVNVLNERGSGIGDNFHLIKPACLPGTYLLVIEGGERGNPVGAYCGFLLRPNLAERFDGSPLARQLDPVGDVDHFEFFVRSRQEVSFYTTGLVDTECHIYNSGGRMVAGGRSNNEGPGYNFWRRETLDPGTYVLRIFGGRFGSPGGIYRLGRGEPDDLLPSIWMTSPRPGARVGNRFVVRGHVQAEMGVARVECNWRGRWKPVRSNGSSWQQKIRTRTIRGRKKTFTIYARVIDRADEIGGTQRVFRRKRR